MARRLHIKRKKKRIKERPFNDEDTEIQMRHDNVRTYCLEPLDRKAKEEPIIERVITKEIVQDYEIQDEDNDPGVRTRKRYLPQMPSHLPFLKGMKNSDDNIQTRDLEMSLRYYNDAIRSNTEMAKIFLLGMVRQLRYWILAQEPRPDLEDDSSHLLYVRDDLLPLIIADFKNVERYMTPEYDLELFRRFPMEITILTHEIDAKLHQISLARQALEEQGFDPLDPDAPQFVEFPTTGIIDWILENPDLAKVVLDNPDQRDELIFGAWKELFQAEGVVQFLELQDKLSSLIELDFQRKEDLRKLQELMKKCSIEDLTEQLERPENYSIRNELLDALNISRSIGHLDLLQKLENIYSSSGSVLPQDVISDPENFVETLITQGISL